MREPAWRREGEEPDYRFTLANERTFLAWIRTSLALVAGAVVLDQLVDLRPQWVSTAAAIVLGVAGAVLGTESYRRWRANEQAMRSRRPLPHSVLFAGLAALVTIAAIVFAVIALVQ